MHPKHGYRLVLAIALWMCVPSAAAAESRPDAWITMKAKAALYVADDVRGTTINVDTINGRVTLHGKVRNEQEKARAAAEVKKIVGVLDVRNLLQIVPPGKAESVERADDALKADIAEALKADHSLDDSSISVKSVNKGVVLLGGKAESANDKLRALRRTAERPGVVKVTSEIEAPDTYADEDFKFEIDTKADTEKRDAGEVISDAWITSAVKMKLAVDERTPATEINVDTYDGVVTLFGAVPFEAGKSAAKEIASSVSGVRKVENDIQVVSPAKQDAVEARDEVIQENVNKALDERGEDIDVEVKNGVVRLTGTVPTWERNLSAVYAARSVKGVRSVLNELRVVKGAS